MASKQSRKGFTIIELMIAISIFAAAMTLVLAGVIFIARQYQQASNRVALEDASRNVHQQVLQSIQFSGIDTESATSGSYTATCVGNIMYVYGARAANGAVIANSADYTAQAEGLFVKDNLNSCNSADVSTANARNILPTGAKVAGFSVSAAGAVSTQFAKAPTDLLSFNAGEVTCNTTITGREYCATVKLDSAAARRVRD